MWTDRLGAATRREFLKRSSFGFGTLALAELLNGGEPLSPKRPHFAAKAKSVIFLFMEGGPSHVDTFDPKHELTRFDGHPLPPSFHSADLNLQFIKASEAKLMGSAARNSKSTDKQVWRSRTCLPMWRSSPMIWRSSGRAITIRSFTVRRCGCCIRVPYGWASPSVGAWIVYGLGSESRNLPAYVVMSESNATSDKSLFGAGFLPAVYQGTMMRTEGAPIENLTPSAGNRPRGAAADSGQDRIVERTPSRRAPR